MENILWKLKNESRYDKSSALLNVFLATSWKVKKNCPHRYENPQDDVIMVHDSLKSHDWDIFPSGGECIRRTSRRLRPRHESREEKNSAKFHNWTSHVVQQEFTRVKRGKFLILFFHAIKFPTCKNSHQSTKAKINNPTVEMLSANLSVLTSDICTFASFAE